jgi:hypothetical protein
MNVGIMVLPGTASPDGLADLGVRSLRVRYQGLLADGRLDPSGVDAFRTAWQPFARAGFRIHAVTPFPSDLPGGDPQAPSWSAAWRRAGAALGEALGDLVESWQIGNELNIWQFRAPLRSTEEAARFVHALATGLRETAPEARLGTNAFGTGDGAAELFRLLYGGPMGATLDYVGIDAYPGCWEPGGPERWPAIIDRVSVLGGGRPIAVCEIGFPSRGEVAAPGELEALLRRLGYARLADVEADRGPLLAATPEPLASAFASLPKEAWAEDFEDLGCHLLRKWRWGWGEGPHSPEKQAAYFGTALGSLLVDPRIEEVLLFMYRDASACWTCGRPDCPLETAWGFVDQEGRAKPVVPVVRELLERLGLVQPMGA